MAQNLQHYRNYLSPELLARLARLELRARMVAEGYLAGMHHSAQRGFSIEFAQHRHYAPGDDLKYIDWKLYARTDRYYLKQHYQQTNLTCILLLDASESMAYNSDPQRLSKYHYAATLAGALAYLLLRQRDAVGLALFNQQLLPMVSPSNRPAQFKRLVEQMDSASPTGKTRLRPVLDELAERTRRRCLVILISDLFDQPAQILPGLHHLRHRRHQVIVLNILDPAELNLPFSATTLFQGLEDSGQILAEPLALRHRYIQQLQRFLTDLRRGCGQMNIDYCLMPTDRPLDLALSALLAPPARQAR